MHFTMDEQMLFGVLVFLVPAVLVFFVWRDVKHGRQGEKRKEQTLLLYSALALSFNILLLYSWYVSDVLLMRGHPISQAGMVEYEFLLVALWTSRIAVLISVATVIMAFFSQRGVARKLCIWGSMTALLCWPVLNVAASDLIAVYRVYHR